MIEIATIRAEVFLGARALISKRKEEMSDAESSSVVTYIDNTCPVSYSSSRHFFRKALVVIGGGCCEACIALAFDRVSKDILIFQCQVDWH